MAGRFVLALDAGGGGGGALVLDLESGAVWTAHRPWRHAIAPGTGGWGYDFDCRGAWRALAEAAREAIAAAECEPSAIAGIVTTAMRHGTVLIDAAGREIFATPNRDARAAGQATGLASEHGADVYAKTGLWPAPLLPLARLKWLAEEEPGLLSEARAVLSISDWLTYRLTGETVSELTQAQSGGLVKLEGDAPDPALVSLTGLPLGLWPKVAFPGAQSGLLSNEAADAFGLQAGTPVFAAPADTQAALFGSGVVDRGLVAVAGTTLPVVAVTASPALDPNRRTWTGLAGSPGRWMVESNAGPAGEALEMLAGMFFPGERLAVARFAAEAASVGPCAGGVLSDLGASLFNASGLALPAGAVGLSPLVLAKADSARAVVARATLEGIAFAVRANIEQIEDVTGPIDGPLAVCGGLSRSDTWLQVVADVTGREVTRPAVPQATLLGAAICGATGLGAFKDIPEAARALSKEGRRFEPASANVAAYEEAFVAWSGWRSARADADERLAEGILARIEDDGAAQRGRAPRSSHRPSALVTAPLDDASLARLRESVEVRYEPFMEAQRVLTDDDLVEALAGVDVLVTEVDIVDASVLERARGLRAVFTCRADPVNVDIAACTAHGVPVMNAPGRNAAAVAEMAVASILALARHTAAGDRFLRDEATAAGDIARMGMAHADFEGRELAGLTIGLIGLGAVGREVAGRTVPWGARVVAADPYADPVAALAAGVEVLDLDAVLGMADVVSLHAPVNDATRGMIGAAEFAAMKPGALFVNTARAALVDEGALADALASKRVGGAALDVFAMEPPGHDNPLLRFANVIATPHIAGNTREVARAQGAMVCTAVEALIDGRAPTTVLNGETLAGFAWTGERRAPTPEELERIAKGAGPAVTDLERDAEAPTPAARPSPKAAPAPRATAPVAAPVSTPPARQRAQKRTRFGLPGPLKDVLGAVGALKPPSSGPRQETDALPSAAAPGVPLEQWERLFALFVERLPGDDAVRRFSQGKDVLVRYDVQDLGIVFHTGFAETPFAALGEPATPPHLTLRMSSAVLDDVFMERVSGMKAAMSGKMAFSGNTRRAMTLQRVQKDMNRVYRGARESLGLPEGPVVAAAVVAAPIQAMGAGAAVNVPLGEREAVIAIVNELFATRLMTSTGGNVSVRREGHPDEAWITPSALPKGHLSPEMLVRIGMDGEPLDAGSLAPSSERLLHTAIYRARPDVEAIVHSHGPKLFALGLAGLPFLPVSTESAFLGELPRVPFIMPGTEELAAATAAAMSDSNAVLLVNHGSVTVAASLRRAADMTSVVEATSGALLDCHAAGIVPPVLPEDVVRELREVGRMVG